ncbi:MAG: KpsF/GutQ family sugar-phosphate isomerase [Bacillota bacterium]
MDELINAAREVLEIEAESILELIPRLDGEFTKAVELIINCNGRVIVTGMGKSGLVGRKIAATLASTGTPSFFLHPGEGIHGDLGMVTSQDVIIAISNSGETEEIMNLLPTIKVLGNNIIAMVGKTDSALARKSDVVLDVRVKREACPLGLAPTASTTAALALGDALAVALLKKRNFQPNDYALFHPGGSLGQKLLATVEKLMHTGELNPVVESAATVAEALQAMSGGRNLGVTSVADAGGKLIGIITDGDLRRFMQRGPENPLQKPVLEIMTRHPKTIGPQSLAAEAMRIMEEYEITVLPVVDEMCRPIGVIHLHDILHALTNLKWRKR